MNALLLTLALLQPSTLDANGWTVLTPSADSRQVYVSSSTGNDANDGLTEATPKLTIAAARTLMRANSPDWMRLKSGDVFSGPIDWRWSGAEPGREAVFTSYGTGPRPVIKNGNWYFHRNENKFHDFAMVGLEFYCSYNDPESPEYGTGNLPIGIQILGSTSSNILFEDNHFRFYGTNVQIFRFAGAADLTGVTFRRNIVADAVSFGLLTSHIDGLVIEENVFDGNGWKLADVFSQGAYIQESQNLIVRNNIFSRSGNFGLKLSADSLLGSTNFSVTDNLFYKSAIGIGHAATPTTYDPKVQFAHQNGIVSNNVIVNPGKVMKNGVKQTFASIFHNIETITVDHNILLDNVEVQASGDTIRFNKGERLKDITLSNNIAHNWFSSTFSQTGSYLLYPEIVENLTQVNDYPVNVQYVDDTRNIASYSVSIGWHPCTESFVSKSTSRLRGAWDTRYTAAKVNEYIRYGFRPQSEVIAELRVLSESIVSSPALANNPSVTALQQAAQSFLNATGGN